MAPMAASCIQTLASSLINAITGKGVMNRERVLSGVLPL